MYTSVFDNETSQYPIILIPNKIQKNLVNGISLERLAKHKNISRPKKTVLNPPTYPEKIKTNSEERTIIFFKEKTIFIFFPTIMGIIVAACTSEDFVSFMKSLGFFMAFILFLNIISFNIKFKSVIDKRTVETNETEFEKQLAKYQLEKKQYDTKVKAVNEDLKKEIISYEKQVRRNEFETASEIHFIDLVPETKAQPSLPKSERGNAEKKFLEYLNRNFYGYFPFDAYCRNNRKKYFPDFTFICPVTNLHIDIEIDEPYTLLGRKPIHFKDCDDIESNKFFLENNWCVIRFTEKQVLENPNECCKTIRSVYESLFRIENCYECWVTNDKNYTYEECLILADNKYREAYLD